MITNTSAFVIVLYCKGIYNCIQGQINMDNLIVFEIVLAIIFGGVGIPLGYSNMGANAHGR